MKAKPLPSLEYLNECFLLDETSPSGLRWKIRPEYHFEKTDGSNWNKRFPGQKAGAVIKATGDKYYYAVRITTGAFKVHRIVYSMFHNIELSVEIEIDHKDCNGLNNRISNLRQATPDQNCQNRRTLDSKSGYRGVSWFPSRNCWRYRVGHKGKKYVGYADTKEEAYRLSCALRDKLHLDFAVHQ